MNFDRLKRRPRIPPPARPQRKWRRTRVRVAIYMINFISAAAVDCLAGNFFSTTSTSARDRRKATLVRPYCTFGKVVHRGLAADRFETYRAETYHTGSLEATVTIAGENGTPRVPPLATRVSALPF